MRRVFLVFIFGVLVSSISYSQELSSNSNILYLFKKYEEASDLSKQTKRESLGHVIVFTRKDLEIMQANYLADVLKLTPLSNFGPNRYGVESLTNLGEPYKISTKYRLYINDHEISSIATYSPFLTYDKYPLDNIDHIEIYYSPGAISVSNEPSQMIIKLYTKLPQRENVSKLKGGLDNKSGHLFSIFSAKQLNQGASYLFTVSHSKINFDKLFVNKNDISRDQERTHLFLQYKKSDWYLDSSFSFVNRDNFFGFSLDGSPDKKHMVSTVGYIAITKYFFEDKSLKTNFAYDIQNRDILEANKISDGGIFFPSFWPTLQPTKIHEIKTMHKIAFTINKEWSKHDNELLIGAFVRYYKQDVNKFSVEYLNNGISKDEKDSPYYNVVDYFWISSIYAENKHNINDKNLIILGTRLDDYKFEGNSKKQELNARFGLISYPKNNLLIKGFITSGYILPSMFMIEMNKNKRLDATDFIAYTLETTYKLNSHSITGFFAFNKVENFPVYNTSTLSLENSGKKYKVYTFALRYVWNVNPFNKFEFNIWKNSLEHSNFNYFSPNWGGYIRLLSEYKDWQFYNELVFKSKYSLYGVKLPRTYNYTFAISKVLNDKWKLNFKGENVLNKSAKIVYKPVIGSPVVYQAFDRRFLITIERVF